MAGFRNVLLAFRAVARGSVYALAAAFFLLSAVSAVNAQDSVPTIEWPAQSSHHAGEGRVDSVAAVNWTCFYNHALDTAQRLHRIYEHRRALEAMRDALVRRATPPPQGEPLQLNSQIIAGVARQALETGGFSQQLPKREDAMLIMAAYKIENTAKKIGEGIESFFPRASLGTNRYATISLVRFIEPPGNHRNYSASLCFSRSDLEQMKNTVDAALQGLKQNLEEYKAVRSAVLAGEALP